MKLAAVFLALLSVALADNAGSFGLSSPILAWSNGAMIGQGKHVSYEVFPNVEQVATDLVLGALGKAEGSDFGVRGFPGEAAGAVESRTVVVFAGSQLDAADMRSRNDAVRSLDAMIGGAASSLALPYTTSQGTSIRETMCTKLDSAGVQHEVVGCSAPSTDLKSDVAAALAKGSDAQLHVVVVCSHVEDAQKATNAGLSAEVEQLKAVQAAVAEAGINHVMVYASQANPADALQSNGSKRRSLLASLTGFGPYTTCGTLCKTQVRWLEGMLAVLFLALASCAGLVCLYVLDTPTRFESPNKDAAPQQ